VVALLVLLGAAQRKALYVDVAIVYGLISFVGTLFIAKLMERKR
jgi:multicomponent Na+:H+ antiporter subunit F